MSSKMILVFCDGTGMDGTLSVGAPEGGGGGSVQNATNVLHLSRAVQPNTTDNRRQIVFYQSGVGSEANFKGDPLGPGIDTAIQALGVAVASKIRDAYVFIAQNFEAGDEICLFGGAYTARKLSGLIDRIGLLQREQLGLFFGIWRQLVDGKPPTIPPGTRRTNIKCVGVWDTVGSVYNTINALSIQDTSLPATIDTALHAVSLQENQEKFLPTLWTIPANGLRAGQVLKQIWFPGAHSDVDGGYERHELADLALFWMAGETQSFINYDLQFLQRSGQQRPEPWGTSQPHNAYYGLSAAQKLIIGHETRLESNQVTRDSTFHPSLGPGYAPTQLTHPDYMVTMAILKSKFGSSWSPSFSSLNAFEDKCKREWGQIQDGPKIPFEDVGELFGPFIKWEMGAPGFTPPQDGFRGGKDQDGSPLYVIRAPYMGGIHPGKFGRLIAKGGAVIGYNYSEINVSDFEILRAHNLIFTWMKMQGRFSSRNLNGAHIFEAGKEANGTPLYVARAQLSGSQGIHCGKIKEGSVALIPHGGKEKLFEEYEVLVYA